MLPETVLQGVEEAVGMGRIRSTGALQLSNGRSVFVKFRRKVPGPA
jgi:hypothetical protein